MIKLEAEATPLLVHGYSYGLISSTLAKNSIDHFVFNSTNHKYFFRDTVIEVAKDDLEKVSEILGKYRTSNDKELFYFGFYRTPFGLMVPKKLLGRMMTLDGYYLERICLRGYRE